VGGREGGRQEGRRIGDARGQKMREDRSCEKKAVRKGRKDKEGQKNDNIKETSSIV